jgi:hypothetical protein
VVRPPHTLFKPAIQRRPKTLHHFYQWCREKGHYQSYEAVERYMKL